MVKKKGVKKGDVRSPHGACPCEALMAAVIIVLVWVSQATWSRVIITIVAALILLGSGSCVRKSKDKKK